MNFEMRKLMYSIRLDSREVTSSPSKWKAISRNEALRLHDSALLVVHYLNCGMYHARWFDRSSPFFSANGPYDFSSVRYFQYVGNLPAKAKPANGGRSAPKQQDPVEEEVPKALDVKSPSKEKVSLFNAVWTGAPSSQGKEGDSKRISTAMLRDTISFKVSTEGLMPGDSISITIMRADNGEKVETVMARVASSPNGDSAIAEWQVRGTALDEALTKGSVELYFVAKHIAKKLECKSGKLIVSDGVKIHHHFDVHEDSAKNDLIILAATDGSWKHTLEARTLKEILPDWVELIFPGAPKGKSFNLIHDQKEGKAPVYLFKDMGYDALIKKDHFDDT